ncbi:hypothetical protein GF377_06725, partial [candidate division GN15 bacterium]|nr:hypothetical protein [candidate division GN15 bacterium]
MRNRDERGSGFLLLLDPDRAREDDNLRLAEAAADCEVDAILVGTSFALGCDFPRAVKNIKERAS